MIPKRCHIIDDFKVPEFFNQKIAVATDSSITDIESKLFYLAMSLVQLTAEVSPPPVPSLRFNVYFLENDSLTFSFGKDVLGCFHQAIIFPIGGWRKQGLTSDVMLLTMVEELCHAVWLIPDGPQIEEKVRETFEQIPIHFSASDFLMNAYGKINQT